MLCAQVHEDHVATITPGLEAEPSVQKVAGPRFGNAAPCTARQLDPPWPAGQVMPYLSKGHFCRAADVGGERYDPVTVCNGPDAVHPWLRA